MKYYHVIRILQRICHICRTLKKNQVFHSKNPTFFKNPFFTNSRKLAPSLAFYGNWKLKPFLYLWLDSSSQVANIPCPLIFLTSSIPTRRWPHRCFAPHPHFQVLPLKAVNKFELFHAQSFSKSSHSHQLLSSSATPTTQHIIPNSSTNVRIFSIF